MVFELCSPAFGSGEDIPDRHTGEGEDVSPPLRWSGPPAATRSFALILDDPDAPGGAFGHWAVFDIPPDWRELPEDLERSPLRKAVRFGQNDMGRVGYGGPAPPRGRGVHHYHFSLMAMDTPALAIPSSASVEEVRRIAARHSLGQAELVGLYERR